MHQLLNLVISVVILLAVLMAIKAQKDCTDGVKVDDKGKNLLKASQVILIVAAGLGVAMNGYHLMSGKSSDNMF